MFLFGVNGARFRGAGLFCWALNPIGDHNSLSLIVCSNVVIYNALQRRKASLGLRGVKSADGGGKVNKRQWKKAPKMNSPHIVSNLPGVSICTDVRQIQCLRYKILPSGLWAEICCNVIGGKKDFPVESGLFRDLFWSRSGPFIAICTIVQNCLK